MSYELQSWEKHVGKHLIATALEAPSSCIDSTVPNDVEYSYDDWEIDTLDGDSDGRVCVVGKQSAAQYEQRSRGSRTHPPEYESHDGTVIITATVDFGEAPLCGEVSATLEYVGGRPTPPDPEPHDV